MKCSYTDDQIKPVLTEHIALATKSNTCLRVNHIAWDIMGKGARKIPIPTSLAIRIRTLAAESGWTPDPTDITRTAATRLYKGGKP